MTLWHTPIKPAYTCIIIKYHNIKDILGVEKVPIKSMEMMRHIMLY